MDLKTRRQIKKANMAMAKLEEEAKIVKIEAQLQREDLSKLEESMTPK